MLQLLQSHICICDKKFDRLSFETVDGNYKYLMAVEAHSKLLDIGLCRVHCVVCVFLCISRTTFWLKRILENVAVYLLNY